MYIVYKHTCVPTGKSYIGFTKKDINVRWKEHVKKAKRKALKGKGKFQNAILKYGMDSFIHEILFTSESHSEALQMEIVLIDQHNTVKNGYNIHPGGLGGGIKGRKQTNEEKRKHSEALKGRKCSEEHIQNMHGPRPSICGEKNHFFGKTHSEESRWKIGKRVYPKGKKHRLFEKSLPTSFKSGKEHPRAIQVIIDNIEYGSINLASIATGLPYRLIKQRLQSGQYKHAGVV